MEATLADRLTSTVGGGRRAGREGAEGGGHGVSAFRSRCRCNNGPVVSRDVSTLRVRRCRLQRGHRPKFSRRV